LPASEITAGGRGPGLGRVVDSPCRRNGAPSTSQAGGRSRTRSPTGQAGSACAVRRVQARRVRVENRGKRPVRSRPLRKVARGTTVGPRVRTSCSPLYRVPKPDRLREGSMQYAMSPRGRGSEKKALPAMPRFSRFRRGVRQGDRLSRGRGKRPVALNGSAIGRRATNHETRAQARPTGRRV